MQPTLDTALPRHYPDPGIHGTHSASPHHFARLHRLPPPRSWRMPRGSPFASGSPRADVRAQAGTGGLFRYARPIARKRDRFQWSRFDAERSRETTDEPTYARNPVEALVKSPARP